MSTGGSASEDRVAATPLLSSGVLRTLLVAILLVSGIVAVLLGALVSLAYFNLAAFGGAAIAFLALPWTAAVIWRARWSDVHGTRVMQMVATVLLGAAYGASAVYCAVRSVDAFATRATLGTTPGELAFWLAGLAASLLVLGSLLAALPLAVSRRRVLRGCVAIGASGLLAAVLAGTAQVGPSDCGAFTFESANWQDAVRGPDASWRESDRLLAAIDRCGTLDGTSRAELVAALGRPDRRDPVDGWSWSAPSPNFGFNFEDTSLTAHFPPGGRRAAEVQMSVVSD